MVCFLLFFWGFVSGTNGRVTSDRALARSRAILHGHKNASPQKSEEIIEHLKKAQELLELSRISDALEEAQRIKFLGMSFASKVIMFMNPDIAAVYDEVISDRLRGQSDLMLKTLHVSTRLTSSQKGRSEQCSIYENWCRWCSLKARALNASAIQWIDWNGTKYHWRAVDVERAFFALG
jgi:hypothetical protein